MKYKPYGTLQGIIEQPFELAFTCNLEDSHSDHFMMVTKDDSGHHAKCLKSRVDFDLEDKHLIWFMVSFVIIISIVIVTLVLLKQYLYNNYNYVFSIFFLFTG